MTKNYSLKLVVALVCMLTMTSFSAFAQLANVLPEKTTLPEGYNPWNVSEPIAESILRNNAQPIEAKKSPAKADAANAEDFIFLGQSFYSGYSFSYDAGDIVNNNVKVTIDGDKVIFHSLFNFSAQSSSWNVCTDEDFEGVYDAESKTITVTTSSNYDDAVIVGHTYSGYYDIVLLGGTVTSDGQFAEDGQVVFDVVGDFEQIKSRNNLMLYAYASGSMMGATAGYRSLSLYKPDATKAMVVAMTDKVTFEKNYIGETLTKTFSLYNVGGKDASVSIAVADNAVFNVTPKAATIANGECHDFTVKFTPDAAGSYNTTATVTSEGSDDIVITLEGNGIEMTDFSPIVKSGEMTITTPIDYSFTLDDVDGVTVARSGASGVRRTQSDLYVVFDVPNGKKGSLKWKGEFNSDYYYNIGGVIADGTIVGSMYGQMTCDFGGEVTDLAPGEHEVDFQYYNDNYEGSIYVYDLELVLEDLPADKASCPREVVSLGHHLQSLKEDISAIIPLYNEGSHDLSVSSITCDNEHFEFDFNSKYIVSTFDTYQIPVTLNTNELGVYEGTATITTSAGVFNVPLKAGVYAPDYSKILKEGSAPFEFGAFDWTYQMNRAPFLVNEDADVPYAYNSTAKDIDYEATYSCLEARFTVPEGYTAHISWEGNVSCEEAPEVTEWYNYDYPYISVGNNYNQDWGSYYTNASLYLAGAHNGDAGSAQYDTTDQDYYYNNIFRTSASEGYISFVFYQVGDATYEAEDCMKIYNLNLELISATGIGNVDDTKSVVSREYYNLAGVRVNRPQGTTIEKVKYSDGSVSSKKIIVK